MPPIKQVGGESGNVEAKRGRPQSGIAYPYFNLDQSIKVARAVHERGGGACAPDQLASFLNYKSVRSGTYLTRVSAARLFGLVVSQRNQIGITDRAQAIISPVMPEDSTIARIDAFLSVPLFFALYEQFKGSTLPPDAGLKNLFEQKFKIVKDRIAPSLRVFYESAEQAGFFALSGDRSKLIKPVQGGLSRRDAQPTAPPSENKDVPPVPSQDTPRSSGGGDGPLGIHPAIIGLLRELPQAGQPWPKPKKDRFLKAFQTTVDFIYPDKDESEESTS